MFHEYDQEVDSLRGEVRELETLDRRGVPRERYDEYLETFERYNRSVPSWEARADSLRAHWAACRSLVQEHNLMTDSVQRAVQALTDPG